MDIMMVAREEDRLVKVNVRVGHESTLKGANSQLCLYSGFEVWVSLG
jgi:hypothetical protein